MARWEVTFHVSNDLREIGQLSGKPINAPNITKAILLSKDSSGKTDFEEIKELAYDGWELVSVTPIIWEGSTQYLVFAFKRPISDDEWLDDEDKDKLK